MFKCFLVLKYVYGLFNSWRVNKSIKCEWKSATFSSLTPPKTLLLVNNETDVCFMCFFCCSDTGGAPLPDRWYWRECQIQRGVLWSQDQDRQETRQGKGEPLNLKCMGDHSLEYTIMQIWGVEFDLTIIKKITCSK